MEILPSNGGFDDRAAREYREPWQASERECCRTKISHRELSLELHGPLHRFEADFVPARDFFIGTVGFHAPGEHGSGNAFSEHDRLAEASGWVERDFVLFAARPPAHENAAIAKFQTVLHRLKHGAKDLLAISDLKQARLARLFVESHENFTP